MLALSAIALLATTTAARRVAGACSPGRELYVRSGTVWSATLIDDSSRTSTIGASRLRSEGAPFATSFSPFEQIEWTGDGDSYLDVFFDATFDGGFEGEQFAPIVRYWCRPDAFAARSAPLDEALGMSLPPQVPLGRPTAIRHYDRGACSASISWRELATGLVDGLDRALDTGLAEEAPCGQARPIGNWIITPILRQELFGRSVDGFRLVRPYSVSFCDAIGGDIRVEIVGRFSTGSRALRFDVDEARVEGFDLADLTAKVEAAIEEDFAARVNAALPVLTARRVEVLPRYCNPGGPSTYCFDALVAPLEGIGVAADGLVERNAVCIPDATAPGGGVCGISPNFHRLHARPEGYEFVLSEWDPAEEAAGRGAADPLFAALDMAGLCDRASAPTRPIEVGYMGSVFEIPPTGTPLPFHDAP